LPDVGIFYGRLVYFNAILYMYFVVIWYILWLFGIFYGYLVHFSSFGMLYQEKSGNPAMKEKHY
jgi:hypothetical protein